MKLTKNMSGPDILSGCICRIIVLRFIARVGDSKEKPVEEQRPIELVKTNDPNYDEAK